jgi:hypothetical protein
MEQKQSKHGADLETGDAYCRPDSTSILVALFWLLPYWATCHSSLSAHFLSLRVNNTSETSLDPFPLKQLPISTGHTML